RAFIAVLQAPRELIHNQALNVGRCGENYRMHDLAVITRETVPGCSIEYAPDAGPDKRCYRVDFSRIAKTLTSFQPRWNARQGAQQLYEGYLKNGLRLEDCEGPRYVRINRIRQQLDSGYLDASLRSQKARTYSARQTLAS